MDAMNIISEKSELRFRGSLTCAVGKIAENVLFVIAQRFFDNNLSIEILAKGFPYLHIAYKLRHVPTLLVYS